MLKCDDSDPELSMQTIHEFFEDKTPQSPGIITIFHDEASFSQNDISSYHWWHIDNGPSRLRPKSGGTNVMVSDFVCEEMGWVRHHRRVFKTGPNNYWNNKLLMEQVKEVEAWFTNYLKEFEGNGFKS